MLKCSIFIYTTRVFVVHITFKFGRFSSWYLLFSDRRMTKFKIVAIHFPDGYRWNIKFLTKISFIYVILSMYRVLVENRNSLKTISQRNILYMYCKMSRIAHGNNYNTKSTWKKSMPKCTGVDMLHKYQVLLEDCFLYSLSAFISQSLLLLY